MEMQKELFQMEQNINADIVLSGADYHHTETLLDQIIADNIQKIIGVKKHLLLLRYYFMLVLIKN